MAVNQPPVEGDLAVAVGESSPSAPAVTEFWKNVLPWDDLDAKSPPERWLEFQRDILPVLAVAIAQGPDAPHLLQTDGFKRLLVTSPPNASARLAAAPGAGNNTIQPDNPLLFPPGSAVILVSQAPASHAFDPTVYVVVGNDGTTLTLSQPLRSAFAFGDFVLSVGVQVAAKTQRLGEHLSGFAFDLNLAAGARGNIVGQVPDNFYYLHRLQAVSTVNIGFYAALSSSVNHNDLARFSAVANGMIDLDLGDMQVAVGEGVELFNNAGVAFRVAGVLQAFIG